MEKQLPGWVMTEKYDITAKTDKHDATKDEMRLMMRALLAERFKLAIHSETQQMPVYGLVLAKPGTLGPRLVAHLSSEPCDTTPPTQAKGAKAPPLTVAGGFFSLTGPESWCRGSFRSWGSEKFQAGTALTSKG